MKIAMTEWECFYVNYTEILKYGLWKAARDGHKDGVLDILKDIGEDLVDEIINHHTSEGGQSTTPLIIAAMKGNEEVVEILLNFGADIDRKGNVIVDDKSHGGVTALWCASYVDHYTIVKLLVEHGADINLPTDSGSTSLMPPCLNGNFEIVRYLVDHGASVNVVNDKKETCPMLASYTSQYKIVKYLFEKGASPESINIKYGLWKAARDGHKDGVLDFLKDIGEDLVDEIINHHTSEGGQSTTPLIIAAMKGNGEVVEILLNFGADIDRKGNVIVDDKSHGGVTALWCASYVDHYTIVKLLVEHGADINLPTDSGSTSLMPPCLNGNFEIVRYLVDHGASVNVVNDKKETCPMLASYASQYKIVKYLIEKGASPESINITNWVNGYGNYTEILKNEVWKAARDGHSDDVLDFLENIIRTSLVEEIVNHHTDEDGQSTTPLIIAAMRGHEEVVKMLLDFGAQINQRGAVIVEGDSRGGATALWCESLNGGHYNIIKLLVEHGADINQPTDNGSTPLRPPCLNGNFEIVRYLIEHGANVNAATNNKQTCLMVASLAGEYEIVQYLLEKGAKPECVTTCGITALHQSAAHGHFAISKLLTETACLTTAIKDNYGITALMYAAMNQECRIVEYLSLIPECKQKDQIDALDLLGTAFLFDPTTDLSKAFHFFERAMHERHKNKYELTLNSTASLISKITDTAESQTLKDLEEIKNDDLSMYTEALAKLERILGLTNPAVIDPMIYTGELFAHSGFLEKCVELWLLSLRVSQCVDISFDYAEYFSEMFVQMLYDARNINFSYLLEVFEGIVTELTLEERRMKEDTNGIEYRKSYDKGILVCLYMVGILLLCKPTAIEKHQLYRAVYKFITLDPRLKSGATPLHMCCDWGTNDNTMKMKNVILFPNTLICKTLLKCGADANAQDENKQTPLHVIAKTGKHASDVLVRKISERLIQDGAHTDACTKSGASVVDVATCDTATDIVKSHMELRLSCIAAIAVMRHKIPYQGVIPSSLLHFVKLH